MRRKLDHLPRGVRWAAWVLKFFGTLMVLPGMLMIPFLLVYAAILLIIGPAWYWDLLSCAVAIWVGIGMAMRLASDCLKIGNSAALRRFDHVREWKDFVRSGLGVLGLIFGIGAFFSALRILIVWFGQSRDLTIPIIDLCLHIAISMAFYLGFQKLDNWAMVKHPSDASGSGTGPRVRPSSLDE